MAAAIMDIEEIDRDQPLYEGVIPVRWCGTARIIEATVRLLSGKVSCCSLHSAAPPRVPTLPSRLLRELPDAGRAHINTVARGIQGDANRRNFIYLEIADEADPFFYHSLVLTDAEFQELRSEQSILVDFGAFPEKLVELLQRCVACAAEAHPSFMATLTPRDASVPGTPSRFCLVETNNFKQLTHLSFSTRAGTDASTKRYLAGRFVQVRRQLHAAQDRLAGLGAETSRLRADLAGVEAELLRTRAADDATLSAVKEAAHAEISALRGASATTSAELRAELEALRSEKSRMEVRARDDSLLD